MIINDINAYADILCYKPINCKSRKKDSCIESTQNIVLMFFFSDTGFDKFSDEFFIFVNKVRLTGIDQKKTRVRNFRNETITKKKYVTITIKI